MFNYLTGYARPRRYRKALVAPFNLQKGLLDEIERTIEAHTPSTPRRIRMKMNSLLDPPIDPGALPRLAGRRRGQLNVRGICALRPGVQGVSENIRVVSVRRPLPRALADLLVRASGRGRARLHRLGGPDAPQPLQPGRAGRPGRGRGGRAEMLDVLDAQLADNTGSWELDAEGEWTRRTPDGEPRNVQREMIERHGPSADTARRGGPRRRPRRAGVRRRWRMRHDAHGYWIEEAGPVAAGCAARAATQRADVRRSSAAATPASGRRGG